MVVRLIVERVTLSRCSQADVQGEVSTSENNGFSMQDNCSDCMLLWLNEQPLSQLFNLGYFCVPQQSHRELN